MGISDEFKKTVLEKNLLQTRIMLKNSMIVDPSMGIFNERLKFAESNLPDLYVEHDGEVFPNDISKWNKDLVTDEMVNVVANFSRERVEFLKNLVRHVYSKEAESIAHKTFIQEHKTINKDTQKVVGEVIVAGGTVATVAGIVTLQPVVAVAGVAVATVGGVVIYKSKS